MVVKKLGGEVWTALLEKAHIEQDFIDSHNYSDELLYTLLQVGSKAGASSPLSPS